MQVPMGSIWAADGIGRGILLEGETHEVSECVHSKKVGQGLKVES